MSSIGTIARTSDLLKSLLEPNASIKQGYNTLHVITNDGRVLTGILQQQTKSHVRLRDANNKEHTLSVEDIDEISPSTVSMMPVGLTENLTRAELVDLVRYLSSLGRASYE